MTELEQKVFQATQHDLRTLLESIESIANDRAHGSTDTMIRVEGWIERNVINRLRSSLDMEPLK
jgi:hypothetical protein